MENEDMDASLLATLRSDFPVPSLRLWDEMIEQTIFPEWADYTEETVLHAQLQGEMCVSHRSVRMDVDELIDLVERLRTVVSLTSTECAWETTYGRMQINLTVQMQKFGPPVLCDVWLRDAITVREEHHCRFETNLTWVIGFLAEIERIALRYRRAQDHFGKT